MCGIAGYFSSNLRGRDGTAIVESMTKALEHRGPDGFGVWRHQELPLYFGHRRLAIVDLSDVGKQPMVSSSGRYTMVYNGEIYNYLELRQELKNSGTVFKGHSDTETLLKAIEEWGLERVLERANGMFAFALWDEKERRLFLCRDRIGEKPLYYGFYNGSFLFASELKALKCYPDFHPNLSKRATELFFKYNYVPTPYSIYDDIFKMKPGCYLSLSLEDLERGSLGEMTSFWRASDALGKSASNRFSADADEISDRLEKELRGIIAEQMNVDVPYGVFLSGGIDSSLVTALMQDLSREKVKTFSIGFNVESYNEAGHASAVAQHLGTDHHELILDAKKIQDVIFKVPSIYDEPFADSSQLPTFLVSKMAREHVTVCLSGDGGDELFAGYNRYTWLKKIWQAAGSVPFFLRSSASKGITQISPSQWDRFFSLAQFALPKVTTPGDKLHKLAPILTQRGPMQMYDQALTHWHLGSLVKGDTERGEIGQGTQETSNGWDLIEKMMFSDLTNYLVDDILVKVDRASMANSLETRIPLLDRRLVELAWRIPLQMKIQGVEGKTILRKILYKYVPRDLIERPKAGFGVPLHEWLRTDLYDWAYELIKPERLERQGILHAAAVTQKWQEHQTGRRNWQHHLWDVLMFQAWLEEQKA